MSSSPKASVQQAKAPQQNQLTERESAHLSLLQHLQRLVEADHQAAREALEMSQEHLPELWLIAQNQPSRQWGQSLTSSDSMHSLISQIDWSQPGSLHDQQALPQDLQSLLEQLP